jgi:hypothetical protein
MPDLKARGTSQEKKTFDEVLRHYQMAKEDLDARIPDFNEADELFRSYIDEDTWPYSALVFDPRTYEAIFEKSARLLANKPRGRMIPREGGDALGAAINNELLSFQWDEAERVDSVPMLAKWALMDMNARKYGASFAVAKWHYEERVAPIEGKTRITWFDGPTFRPWNNRDVLHNPSYSSIKNWIQLRDYVTFDELKRVNDAARGKPVYKNLDILRQALEGEGGIGDTRVANWQSRNLAIKGLQDFLGRDPSFKVVELITEYQDDRWIVFAPKHGVILRDIPNPYLHGRIPVVMLKYYSIDEDIYGLSEIEPTKSLQKANNALICQYLDSVNLDLNKILKVRGGAVQMHTLEFGMGKKWIMNDPQTDVVPYETSGTGVAEFASTYRFIVGAMQEAWGETSAATSQLVPGGPERTATEIRETTLQRNVRDNFNQIFLAAAIKQQMMFWHMMNQQFLFDKKEQHKVIRIVGSEAMRYFEERGLAETGLTDEVVADPGFDMTQVMSPIYGVETKEGTIPKLEIEEGGEIGHLIVEPDDLSGNYDYIPEVRSMELPDVQQIQILRQMIEQAKDPTAVALRLREGYRLKLKDLEQDFFEMLGMKDSSKYYERIGGEEAAQEIATLTAGEGGAPTGGTPAPAQGQPRMARGAQAVS